MESIGLFKEMHENIRVFKNPNPEGFIEAFCGFADKARKKGLLALEDDLETITDPLLKKGLQLVIDGTDPNIISEILDQYLKTEQQFVEKFLEATNMGSKIIQMGDNPRILADQLYCIFGYSHPAIDALVNQFIEFSQKARRQGLLALESNMDELKNPLMYLGLKMVVDGYDPRVLQSILEIRKNALLATNAFLQELIKSGILQIQCGYSPKKMRTFFDLMCKDMKEIPSILGSEKRETPKREGFTLGSNIEINSIEDLLQLDNRSIQMILREVSVDWLIQALKDAPTELVNVIKQNMSVNAANELQEHLDTIQQWGEEQIATARQRLIEITNELQKQLNIPLPDFGKKHPDAPSHFDELATFDNRSIQKVLREVDTFVLARAMQNAKPETQEKIYSNMSKRAAALLQEDIEFMGKVPEKDVLNAQDGILSIVGKLREINEL